MRFSTIVAFMLPLTALAAPTLVQRQDNLQLTGDQLSNAVRNSRDALGRAFETATRLGLANTLISINAARGPDFQGVLEPAVGILTQSIDQNGIPNEAEYVDTPHWLTILTRCLILQPDGRQ